MIRLSQFIKMLRYLHVFLWGVFAHPHGRNYCFPLSLNKNVLKLFAGISFYKSRDKKVQMRVLPKVQHTFPDYGSCKDVCIYICIFPRNNQKEKVDRAYFSYILRIKGSMQQYISFLKVYIHCVKTSAFFSSFVIFFHFRTFMPAFFSKLRKNAEMGSILFRHLFLLSK